MTKREKEREFAARQDRAEINSLSKKSRSPLQSALITSGMCCAALILPMSLPAQTQATDGSQPLEKPAREIRRIRDSGEHFEALERALVFVREHPNDSGIFFEYLETIKTLGGFGVAQDFAKLRPDLLSNEQLSELNQDVIAVRLRHGQVAQSVLQRSEKNKLTEAALAEQVKLISELEQLPSNAEALHRAWNDYIVALVQKDEWPKAIAFFETRQALVAQSQGALATPSYVKVAVAEAYMGMLQPAKAVALLKAVIAANPPGKSWSERLSLGYALMDSSEHEKARLQISHLIEDVKAAKSEAPDSMRERGATDWLRRLAIVRINFERFSNHYDHAQSALNQSLSLTPFDLDMRVANTGLQLNRAKPRLALAMADRARTDHPDSMWAHVAAVEARLDLSDYGSARTALESIEDRFGRSRAIERMRESITIRQKGVVRLGIDAIIGERFATATSPTREFNTRLSVESPMYSDHWRLVAQARGRSANSNGLAVESQRLYGGVRFESMPAEIEVGVVSPLRSNSGRSAGAEAHAVLMPSDAVRITPRLRYNTDDISVRALAAGTTLNTGGLSLQYRVNESRVFSAQVDVGRFSDGNNRIAYNLGWNERWYQTGRWSVETTANASTVSHTQQSGPYFSPSRATALSTALVVTHVIKTEVGNQWKHKLLLEPAKFMQKSFTSYYGSAVRYEHSWEIQSQWGGSAALTFARRPYDGNLENRVALSLEVFWRFGR